MYNKMTFIIRIAEKLLIVFPSPLTFCLILATLSEVKKSPENLMCKLKSGKFCENSEEYVKDFKNQEKKLPPKSGLELKN